MTVTDQAAPARREVPLLVRWRRWRTFCLLACFGSKKTAGIPHEPYPDLLNPGLCNIDLLSVDAPVHQRGRHRKARRARVDGPAERGWR